MPAFSPERYVEALRYAAAAHRGQCVPGTELPYVVHVVSVAAEVIAALPDAWAPGNDLAVQCALLHDTIEDTGTYVSVLAERFGEQVARGVDALSKRPDLPKDRQMDDSLDRILACPPEVAWVKLADRITNLSAPPPHWSAERCAAYRAEAEHILARLGATHAGLARRLEARIAAYPGGRG